ncbi:hypothetical protein [Aliikangiella sp. IMCC44359]|uniref:hypothetical protein n=1 Tax=Aliikangiella sp. IMCC44359 TaxID=3459125 RepID=UPI00403B27C6
MRTINCLLLLLLANISRATEQIPEEFIIGHTKFSLNIYPLESHPNSKEIRKKIISSTLVSTANHRGYIGTWALRDGQLWLDRIIKGSCSENSITLLELSDLFFGQTMPIKATWFTDNINLGISERKYFFKDIDGYSGVEFEAVVLKFESGKLVSRNIEKIVEKYN